MNIIIMPPGNVSRQEHLRNTEQLEKNGVLMEVNPYHLLNQGRQSH